MSVRFSYQKTDFCLDNPDKIVRWIEKIVADSSFRVLDCATLRVGRIDYLFCSDSYLLEINQRFLNHDTYTDIISFDNVGGGLVSGEIMISVDRVMDNASIFGVTMEQELHRVIIHGVLHLLGQSDKNDFDAREMRNKEERALKVWNTME